MNPTFKLLEERKETDLYQEIEFLIKKEPWTGQSVLAMLGLAGGIIAPVLSGISDFINWFVSSNSLHSYLHVLSIVLCALTIPLLILGASCLDLLEAKTSKLSSTASVLPAGTFPATALRHIARPNGHHHS